jgi:predicted ATPase
VVGGVARRQVHRAILAPGAATDVGATVLRISEGVRRWWAGYLEREDAQVHLFVGPRDDVYKCAVCGETLKAGQHAGSLLDNRASFI